MHRLFAFIVALTLFIGLQTRLYIAHDHESVFRDYDGVRYLQTAATGERDAFHGPVYPTAIRTLSRLGLEPYSAAKLISRVSGLVVIVMSLLVLRRITDTATASYATLLLVVTQPFIQLGHAIMSDMIAAAFFWIALAATIVPRRRHVLTSLALGVAIGCAYLTRYGYLVALVLPILLLFTSREQWRSRIFHAGLALAGFLGVAGPHVLFVFRTPHAHLFGENHLNVAFRVLSGGKDWYQFGQVPVNSVIDVIRLAPIAFLQNWGNNLISVPGMLANTYRPFGPLLLVGLVMWFARWNLQRLALTGAFACYLLITGVAWFDDRLLLPMLPLAACAIAEGISGVADALVRWKKMIFLRGGLVFSGIGVVTVSTAMGSTFLVDRLLEDRTEYELATQWLQDKGVNPQTPVACSEPLVAVRAHAHALDLRMCGGAGDDLLNQLVGGYLILDWRGVRDSPAFARLFELEQNQLPTGLSEVFVNEQPRLVIYRVDSGARLPDPQTNDRFRRHRRNWR